MDSTTVVESKSSFNTIAEALANATPKAQPAIRYVSFMIDSKNVAIVGAFFTDDSLVGRRFKLEVSPSEIRFRESETGALVRYIGNSKNSVALQIACGRFGGAKLYPSPWRQTNLNIRPEWSHGKLLYRIPTPMQAQLEPPPVKMQFPEQPTPTVEPIAEAIPEVPKEAPLQEAKLVLTTTVSPTALRRLLATLRHVEQISEYRLERSADGELQFVARIV